MINRILLDMDDTLNHFCIPVLRQCAMEATEENYPNVGWDIIAAYRHYGGVMSEAWFWEVAANQVANLPISDVCVELVERSAEIVGRENVFVCTKPFSLTSYADKITWIRDNLPTWIHNQYILTQNKEVCASPTTLLIDDHDDNVNGFIKAGGQGLLVPRPWNTLRGTNTHAYLAAVLDHHSRGNSVGNDDSQWRIDDERQRLFDFMRQACV